MNTNGMNAIRGTLDSKSTFMAEDFFDYHDARYYKTIKDGERHFFEQYAGPAAFLVWDDGKVILDCFNDQYLEETETVNLDEADNVSILSYMDDNNSRLYKETVLKAIATQEEQSCTTQRMTYSQCCGENIVYIKSNVKVLGHNGKQYLLYATVRNTTDEENRLSDISDSEAKFRLAAEQANIYAWEYDIRTKEMRPCVRCMRDLGLPAVLSNYPEPVIDSGLFPADYADMYREWHQQIADGVKVLESVIPLTGNRIPFHVRYTTVFDDDGKPIKAYGSATMMVDHVEELEQALAMANQAIVAKNAFLSNMSHDIRTPLNGIIGLLEINERNPDDGQLIADNRKKMRVAANHLLSLINDILDLSKMENENTALSHDLFDIREVFNDVELISSAVAEKNGIRLNLHTDVRKLDYPLLYGSPLHLKQIFLNIINNAIKYNKPNGKIDWTIETAVDGEKVIYTCKIEDTGIGMSQEFQQKMFEPFTQEKSDARSVYNGTGLGLSIVNALIHKMGGTVEVHSEIDVGTSFVISIPFDIGSEAELDIVEQLEVVDNSIEGVKILLVEDNELNSDIATMIFEEKGSSVTVAANGKEAVDILTESPADRFDVVLMDINMPVMNGYEAAHIIRNMPKVKDIPIIAMTACTFDEDIKKCREAGMNAHIAKPIDVEQAISTICKYAK